MASELMPPASTLWMVNLSLLILIGIEMHKRPDKLSRLEAPK